MIFIKNGYDIFGGSLAFAAALVTTGVLLSIVNRVRTVEMPNVAIVLEDGDDSDGGPVDLDEGAPGPNVQEVSNVVAASMLPDEDVERALLIPPSPRNSFGGGLGLGGNVHGASGAVLLMSQRALRNQSRSAFHAAFVAPRVCRFGLIVLDVFVFLVLVVEAFAAYQAVAIAVDASIMAPPPGILYPVSNGSHKLHLYCIDRQALVNATFANTSAPSTDFLAEMPSGNVTVILESGLGAVSTYWSLVQPELVNRTGFSADRVCSYDRAGYGWSQRGEMPRTSAQIATELYDLLISANLSGPFVLVGHSFGGMNVRLFAAKYPRLVSGLVLVDASHEFQAVRFEMALNKSFPLDAASWGPARKANLARITAPIGVYRISNVASKLFVQPQLSAQDQSTSLAWTSVNSFPDAVWSELVFFNTESSSELNKTRYGLPGGSFGQLPLAVLTAGANINGTCAMMNLTQGSPECEDWNRNIASGGPLWYTFQKDLASLSSNSSWEIVWQSGHNIPLQFPEKVIDTILDVAERSKHYMLPSPPQEPIFLPAAAPQAGVPAA